MPVLPGPFFYPRSPCGERLSLLAGLLVALFSIHALLAESDTWMPARQRQALRCFLSTLSLRRATTTHADNRACKTAFLSTLSLRRATAVPTLQPWHAAIFYPRSPCGERRGAYRARPQSRRLFYPRSPCGERRIQPQAAVLMPPFSIHALLAESDNTGPRQRGPDGLFYPRSPCGERPRAMLGGIAAPLFSIHALLAESDKIKSDRNRQNTIFLSTLSLRRATSVLHSFQPLQELFYPRSPCGERPSFSGHIRSIRFFYPRSPCGERRTSL